MGFVGVPDYISAFEQGCSISLECFNPMYHAVYAKEVLVNVRTNGGFPKLLQEALLESSNMPVFIA